MNQGEGGEVENWNWGVTLCSSCISPPEPRKANRRGFRLHPRVSKEAEQRRTIKFH